MSLSVSVAHVSISLFVFVSRVLLLRDAIRRRSNTKTSRQHPCSSCGMYMCASMHKLLHVDEPRTVAPLSSVIRSKTTKPTWDSECFLDPDAPEAPLDAEDCAGQRPFGGTRKIVQPSS